MEALRSKSLCFSSECITNKAFYEYSDDAWLLRTNNATVKLRVQETVRLVKLCLSSMDFNEERHKHEAVMKEDSERKAAPPTTDEFTVRLTEEQVKEGRILEEKLRR